MLSIAGDIALVDLSHDLPAHDVPFAALELAATYKYFPAGTIFLVVVDPGVGTSRRGIAAEAGEWKFVAPDNGVLTAVFQEVPPKRVVELTERRYARPTVSRTFEGRDRFAPAAAWLAKGTQLPAFGRTITDFHLLDLPRPQLEGATIRGVTVRIDRFGNIVTNVDRKSCERLSAAGGGVLHLTVGGQPISADRLHVRGYRRRGNCGAVWLDRSPRGRRRTRRARPNVWVSGPARRSSSPGADRSCWISISPKNTRSSSRRSASGPRGKSRRGSATSIARTISIAGILPQMAELGLLGASVPVEYGGAGMDYISLGVISEELEYCDTSLRVIMSVHAGLNCLTLLTWGTEDQKQRYLVPQAQGGKIATYGLTEPSAGSDVRGIQTTAIKRDGHYVLNGEKMWISLADVADNFLVFAWSDAREEATARSGRPELLHRRARLQGILERNADAEVGHSRRQHRLLQDGRRRGAGREPRRARGRRLQDRDVRARSGPLHGRRGRDGVDSRVPRRQHEVRLRAPRVRRRDRRSTSWSRK